MKTTRAFILASLLCFSLAGCISGCKKGDRKEGATTGDPTTLAINLNAPQTKSNAPKKGPWFQGSVEEAFALAQKKEKPIFLYWGAVWCPPCNSMKAEIFAHPEFERIMAPFVSVYLDGDSERAQIWGERLGATGYPILLFLSPRGEELLRISSGLTFQEYSDIVQSTLVAARPIKKMLEKVKGGATLVDWQIIAQAKFGDLKRAGFTPAQSITELRWIVDNIPDSMLAEKAVSTAALLESAASEAHRLRKENGESNTELHAALEKVKSKSQRYVETIFANAYTIYSARNALLWGASDFLTWLFPDPQNREGGDYLAIRDRWLKAARILRNLERNNIRTRLAAHYPDIAIYQLEHPKEPFSAQLREENVKTILPLVAAMKTPSQRKAGISLAVYLLRNIAAWDEARRILDEELKSTSTPWYYQSAYAALEEKAGNAAAALSWAKRASASALGGATRLQWITNELVLSNKLQEKRSPEEIALLAQTFFAQLLSMPGGFSGRNHRSARRFAKELSTWKNTDAVKKILHDAMARCKKQIQSSTCKAYLAPLLSS